MQSSTKMVEYFRMDYARIRIILATSKFGAHSQPEQASLTFLARGRKKQLFSVIPDNQHFFLYLQSINRYSHMYDIESIIQTHPFFEHWSCEKTCRSDNSPAPIDGFREGAGDSDLRQGDHRGQGAAIFNADECSRDCRCASFPDGFVLLPLFQAEIRHDAYGFQGRAISPREYQRFA